MPRDGSNARRPSAEVASSGPIARRTGRAAPPSSHDGTTLVPGLWLAAEACRGWGYAWAEAAGAALGEPRAERATQRAPKRGGSPVAIATGLPEVARRVFINNNEARDEIPSGSLSG